MFGFFKKSKNALMVQPQIVVRHLTNEAVTQLVMYLDSGVEDLNRVNQRYTTNFDSQGNTATSLTVLGFDTLTQFKDTQSLVFEGDVVDIERSVDTNADSIEIHIIKNLMHESGQEITEKQARFLHASAIAENKALVHGTICLTITSNGERISQVIAKPIYWIDGLVQEDTIVFPEPSDIQAYVKQSWLDTFNDALYEDINTAQTAMPSVASKAAPAFMHKLPRRSANDDSNRASNVTKGVVLAAGLMGAIGVAAWVNPHHKTEQTQDNFGMGAGLIADNSNTRELTPAALGSQQQDATAAILKQMGVDVNKATDLGCLSADKPSTAN